MVALLSHLWFVVYLAAHVAVLVRVFSVRGKEPSSRAAWAMVLLFLPGVGIIAYLLFGEPWISRRSFRKAGTVVADLARQLPPFKLTPLDDIPDRFRSVFRTCEYIAGYPVGGGNKAALMADSNASVDAMVHDFDRAQKTIHISFYIWLKDDNGLAIIDALKRAAKRGIDCRVIADGIGSRALIRSRYWRQLKKAGVKVCTAMKVTPGVVVALGSRVDLRNHRKIVVIDNAITYTGSQNAADPAFLPKAKYGPWEDIWLRFEGPVVMQNQFLFVSDWMIEAGEDISHLLAARHVRVKENGFPAIAFGTGPTSAKYAMLNVFVHLLYCAEFEVVISNPYFVPDSSLLEALVCCARRGVKVTFMLPARNDSKIVGAISSAYYPTLVRAGVALYHYQPGLLHAKTLVVDRKVALIGSSNMDRRSLELNFENNILLCSSHVVGQIRERQDHWLADCLPVNKQAVLERYLPRQIGDNLVTIFGPLM